MAKRSRNERSAPARLLRLLIKVPLLVLAAYFALCTALLVLYRFAAPPVTGVQIQRQIEAWADGRAYSRHYEPVRADAISDHLRHAAVAAEDGRFYEHGGVDWDAVQQAIEDNRRRGYAHRGGSTITQQLVKNLFQTTHSSYVRKGLELPLTYLAELVLPKERILTLYLNVIEWDDGVYGAEAAAQRYYGVSADALGRYQSAALAAVIPNPRARTPQGMGGYANTILTRMGQMGW